MKTGALLALLITAFALPAARAETYYTYNGASIQPLFGDPHQVSCARWTIWYFRRDAPQVQGAQWGSATGKSPEEVIAARDQGVKDELAWQAGYLKWGMKYTLPNFTYLNSLGPICLIKGSIGDVLPGDKVDQALDQLEQVTARLQKLLETTRKLLEMSNGVPHHLDSIFIPKLYDDEKSEVEEYVDKLQEQLEHVNTLKNGLTRLNQPSLATVFNNLEGVNRTIRQDESQLPRIKELTNPITVVQPSKNDFLKWDPQPNIAPAPTPTTQVVTAPVGVGVFTYTMTNDGIDKFWSGSTGTYHGYQSFRYIGRVEVIHNSDGWTVLFNIGQEGDEAEMQLDSEANASLVCNFAHSKIVPTPTGSCQ